MNPLPRWHRPFPLRPLVLVLFSAPAAADLTVSAALDYSEGKYGGDRATALWYLPLALKYETGPHVWRLTVPWLRMRSPGGGNLVGVDGQGWPVYDGTGPMTREEGLGDVVAAYSYSLFPEPRSGFLLDLGGRIKFPTADEDRGLGTGKADFTGQADLYYLAGAWTPFATLSYRVSGDPAGLDLRNVWGGVLGLAYRFSAETSAGLLWDARQAVTAGGDPGAEALLYWTRKFRAGWQLQTYLARGGSDASPDWGLGMMLSRSVEK